jgi:hypothetical protein
MQTIELQDWLSLKCANTVTSFPQESSKWLDVTAFKDVVFWLEVRAVTSGGASSFTLVYETAPSADEALFTAINAPITLAVGGPTVTKVLLSAASVPIARFVRWKISQTGATGSWDVTFRVFVAGTGE